MKKILSLTLAVLMLVGTVFACTSCNTADPSGDNGDTPAKDTLVCGVTIFENMNELDANGNWTGFESEFAMAVGEIIGMDVEFKEIDWGMKYNELNSGAIDCVWNGFTANSSDDGIKRSDLVDFSYGYMLNQQCVVVKKADIADYKTEDDLMGKTACVEGGSAGAAYASEATDKELLEAVNQLSAFTELAAGAVDFIVVDIILAENLCGKENFSDLAIVEDIVLASEIYAVGFKKGSDLTAKVNAAIKQLEEDGTLLALAEKYGFENVLKVTEEIE